jgi:regulatory protein
MADALSVALSYLNRRERTVAEVRAHLQRADFDDAAIEATVEELLGFGYLDDARFARVFTQDKQTLEQWGRERIARTLSGRGIDRELISAALGETGSGDELDRAVELLATRFTAPPQEPRDRERAFGVLVRKGYDSELAADAVRAWSTGVSRS